MELDCSKLMLGGSRRDGWGTIEGGGGARPHLATRLHWTGKFLQDTGQKYRTTQENIWFIGHMYVFLLGVYTSAMCNAWYLTSSWTYKLYHVHFYQDLQMTEFKSLFLIGQASRPYNGISATGILMNLDIAAVNDLVIWCLKVQRSTLVPVYREFSSFGKICSKSHSLGRISLKEVNLRNVGEYCQGTEK